MENGSNEPFTLNLNNFSVLIGERWEVDTELLKNYFLSYLSLALIKTKEALISIEKIYETDSNLYYEAAYSSSALNHIILTKGSLKNQINASKALGLLIVAEEDMVLRNKLLKLLKKHYALVYKAVKTHDKKILSEKYMKLKSKARKEEAALDAAVYFYFGLYYFSSSVDQNFFNSILEDARNFEFYDPLTRDIKKELDLNKKEIQDLKAYIKKLLGSINTYEELINHPNKKIQVLSVMLENLCIINKIDIKQNFNDYFNLDDLILAYLKINEKDFNDELFISTIVSGIFFKILIKEYKENKNIYWDNSPQKFINKLKATEEELLKVNTEKNIITKRLDNFQKQKDIYVQQLEFETISASREITKLQNDVKNLELRLLQEQNYKNELNELREYVISINEPYIPKEMSETLETLILNKKIVIWGGSKEWRRKFRDKYEQIRTLNGFNENFDVSVLNNIDMVFFYTKFMNHATYYRAINLLKQKQIPFSYIGKTNLELVEAELAEEVKKLS